MSSTSSDWWSAASALPGLGWTQHPGSVAVACLLIATLTACTSEPATEPRASTAPPVESSNDESGTAPRQSSAPGTHDELKVELLEMMEEDQLERTGEGLPPGTPLPPIQDYARASRLAEIVDEYGWPTFDMVGTEGGTAAWLIAQHADHDVELQLRWLDLMSDAARIGQADPTELAYLTDRVAVNRSAPQTYGTQIRCRGGKPAPATPIENDESVDERRRAVDLEPLADYYDELSMMCAQEEAEGQSPAD